MNQLACAMYLIRFSNVLIEFLDEKEKLEFLQIVPRWEFGNLDTMLVPYINQKYDVRFIRGIKELLAKGLIGIKDELVHIVPSFNISIESELIRRIQKKAYYASRIVKETNITSLNKKISQISGEQLWGKFSLSTE
ncbi:hypothetical protein MJ257_21840 [Paenibacillus timonensis]|uniref:Uncharacterized protein n=1 Tax=Paenibacillus timonensis TaxID=225915 RepID=A0ABW3SHV6_9BACL|nr:hypothetical protein [Paenibacillus timonensis]EBK2059924.1 hypothetical protein [Salmonella enterica subsp. enterica serovar Typhi]MCH1642744.1 hypothetical protein [Paenibacillus timonensis]